MVAKFEQPIFGIVTLAAIGTDQITAPTGATPVIVRSNGEAQATTARHQKHANLFWVFRRYVSGHSLLVNDASRDDSHYHFRVDQVMRIDLKNVLREDDQIGQLSRFERTFGFLPMSGERGI